MQKEEKHKGEKNNIPKRKVLQFIFNEPNYYQNGIGGVGVQISDTHFLRLLRMIHTQSLRLPAYTNNGRRVAKSCFFIKLPHSIWYTHRIYVCAKLHTFDGVICYRVS